MCRESLERDGGGVKLAVRTEGGANDVQQVSDHGDEAARSAPEADAEDRGKPGRGRPRDVLRGQTAGPVDPRPEKLHAEAEVCSVSGMEYRDNRRRSAGIGRRREQGFAPERRLAERHAVWVCKNCCSDRASWWGCDACGSDDVEMLSDQEN